MHIILARGNTPGLYAIRDNGGISKATNLEGVRNENNKIPYSFILKQNYPNPFNPVTKIGFSIPESGMHVRLIVFDMLGRKVATLVNENLQPGTYSADFDGSNLSSGTYFYNLSATGGNFEFHKTLKMELIK